MYNLAFDNLAKIANFELDWDGEGASPFSTDTIHVAFDCLSKFHAEGKPCPSDVYAHSNEIIIEWQYSTKVIERVIITELGKNIICEKMTTYPDKPPVFEILKVTV